MGPNDSGEGPPTEAEFRADALAKRDPTRYAALALARVAALSAADVAARFFQATASGEVGKFKPGALADFILEEQPMVHLADMGKELRWFEGRVWQRNGEVRLTELVHAALDKPLGDVGATYLDLVSVNGLRELESQVRLKCQAWHDAWVTQELTLIPLENGVLDIDAGALAPYDHDKHHFLAFLPLRHDPAATCPAFDRFVEGTVAEARWRVVYEMFGYCLWRDYTYKKAIMLTASGDNGKSILLDVLEEFLGADNIANQPLAQLSESRFAAAALKDKLANIGADLPDRAVKETGMFKMLTGHDTLSYERKGQDASSFRNHAKLIFSANKIPDARDTTEAYFSRWVIVEFPWTFVRDPKTPTQKKARDRKELTGELTTPAELSGLLNKAVAALAVMRAQNGFSYDLDATELKREYTRRSNSLKAFVDEECDIAPARAILVEDFYREYVRYCEREGMAPKEVGLVGREMRQYAEVTRHMKRVDSERKYEYHGVTVKSLIPTEEAIEEGVIQQTEVERFGENTRAVINARILPEERAIPEDDVLTSAIPEQTIPEPIPAPCPGNGHAEAEAKALLDALGASWDASVVGACLNYILSRLSSGDPVSAWLVRSEVGARMAGKRETVTNLVDARYADLERCAKAMRALGAKGAWP